MESDVITLQDLFEFKIDEVTSERTVDRQPAVDRAPAERSCDKFEKHGVDAAGQPVPARRRGRTAIRRAIGGR